MASLTHKIFASLKAGRNAIPAAPESHSVDSTTSASPSPSPSSLSASWNERVYHVAVQGCCHGELDRIYDACAAHEQQTGKRIDVLICCGDFQAVRTASDMDSMAVPDKFKVMGDFHKYWRNNASATPQNVTAPYLTIFVGGNHENSDLLAQESYGGFVAPNIYYLGHSGVVTVDNCLRVAGLSGIFKEQDYDRPYPPRPYAASYDWKKGAYHVRRIEVAKLDAYLRAAQALQRGTADAKAASVDAPLVDIFVSHDWPVGITAYGDEAQLLRFKPYFRDDIHRHALGNPHTMNLLRVAKPVYWVAAHLHCFFEATVSHNFSRSANDAKGGGGDAASASPAPTKFVALDKCARGSGFLTFLNLPRRFRDTAGAEAAGTAIAPADPSATVGATRIQRDRLWLEVLVASHPFVAENHTTMSSSALHGGRGGFDVGDTVRELVVRHTAGPLDVALPFAAAVAASSTEALLRALQLPPALPLQQRQQQNSSTAAAPTRYGQGRQHAAPSAATQAESTDLHRHHQRPRTETSTERPAAAAAFSAVGVTPSAPAPLSFFEDVEAAPPPSSSAAGNGTPAPLGWYEDTTV